MFELNKEDTQRVYELLDWYADNSFKPDTHLYMIKGKMKEWLLKNNPAGGY